MKFSGGYYAKAVLLSAFLLTVIFIPITAALPVPNVRFIPETISENGSFLMIVDPMVYDLSTRVTWVVPAFVDTNIGLFPRIGDKWVCYFSNDDREANCGPTPFSSNLASYDITVKSVDSYGDTGNVSLEEYTVGPIKLKPLLTPAGSVVSILVYPSGGIPSQVHYAIYDSDFNQKADYKLLTMDPNTGYFKGKATLDAAGTYYFAFKTDNDPVNYGGGVMKLDFAKTGNIPGTLVTGEVESDSIALHLLLNKTQVYRNINNEMRNIGERNLTGLAVEVDSKLSDVLSIELEKLSLLPGQKGYFTVKLEGVKNRMDVITFANVTSNNSVVGQISLALNISVLNECVGGDGPTECPECPTADGDFTISPAVWEGDFLVGDSPAKIFEITNTGDSDLTFDISDTGDLGSTAAITTPESINPNQKGEMTVEISPSFAGTYSGIVTVRGSTGSQKIVVNTKFHNDVSDDIISTKSELDALAGLGIDQSVLDRIETELTQAEDDLNFGNYEYAEEGFRIAATKIDVITDILESGYTPPVNGNGNGTEPAPGSDNSLIIIILVVVLAVLGGLLLYLKKFRKAGGLGGGDDIEAELSVDEEGY